MRFQTIWMQDISPLPRLATISLSFPSTWNGLLSIACLYIFLANIWWHFGQMPSSTMWLRMSRTLHYLHDSRPIKILTSLLLERMTIFIRNSPRSLSGTKAKQSGRFVNDTRPLDGCTLFLSLLAKPFICSFCSLWSKVLIFLTIQSQSETHVWFLTGATSYKNLHSVNGVLHDSFKEACCARALLQDDRE
jgi:hypothetical protein